MPGVGEIPVLEKKRQQAIPGEGQTAAQLDKVSITHGESETVVSASADTTIPVGKVKHGNQSGKPGETPLSVLDVMSAPLSQATEWASTRGVIWAMLAAACRQERGSCSTPETQRSMAGSTGATCAGPRRATCALLARVFGSAIAGGEDTDQRVTGIGRKEASIALDWWYQGFCSVTALPCDGGVGTGERSPFPLQEEAPRLLLEGMLEIPAVKAAFVKRGLTLRLTDALRVQSLEMKNREACLWHHAHSRYSPDGGAPSCGTNKLPEDGRDSSSARAAKSGGAIRPRDYRDADGKANLPWRLLFSKGREERGGEEHGHGFLDTLKNPGGSTDGASSEVDGRSCQTALDEIFAPERGKEERGVDTSREGDPTDGNSLGSAGEMSLPATAKQRECREREKVSNGSSTAGGGAKSTKTGGRVAPPMLRLDALGSILDTKECASARFCSSHAGVVSLSAASTRAASEHLVGPCACKPFSVFFLSFALHLGPTEIELVYNIYIQDVVAHTQHLFLFAVIEDQGGRIVRVQLLSILTLRSISRAKPLQRSFSVWCKGTV